MKIFPIILKLRRFEKTILMDQPERMGELADSSLSDDLLFKVSEGRPPRSNGT